MSNMTLRNEAAVYYFQQKKYLVVDNLLCHNYRKPVCDEYLQKSGEKDAQCPVNSDAYYGEPKCEYLLVNTLPKIEKLTGLKLEPTYSYMRVYRPGEELEWHLDRPSCEISATINLGQSGEYDWPIWAAMSDDYTLTKSISLKPGDAMIYRGMEVPHWREKFDSVFEDDWQVQLFLHYVNRHGPHAHHKFDGRAQLTTEPFGEE